MNLNPMGNGVTISRGIGLRMYKLISGGSIVMDDLIRVTYTGMLMPSFGTTCTPGLRSPQISRPPTPPIPVPAIESHGSLPTSNASSRRTSYTNSLVSEPHVQLLERPKDRSRTIVHTSRNAFDIGFRTLPRNISDTSLRRISEDNSSIEVTERKAIFQLFPKGFQFYGTAVALNTSWTRTYWSKTGVFGKT